MNKLARFERPGAFEAGDEQKASRFSVRELVRKGLLVVLVLGLIAGLVIYLLSGRYVSTDNAFVQANKSFLSAQVEGRAVEIDAQTNQRVKAGEVLFRIDDAQYRIAVAKAKAQVEATRNEISALQASYREKQAALGTTGENIAYAKKEFDRQKELVARGVVSKVRFDQAEHDLNVANQKRDEARQDLASIDARLNGNPGQDVDKNPEVMAAVAAYEQAKLDLEHTVVRAPEDGIVASVNLQLGEHVEPGKPVVSLVATRSLWVTANFKETELTHVHAGQKATVSVDLYPDKTWHATVGSISPATGAEFSLIPPQNASGNWVKVVQRLPVRVYLTDYTGDPPLAAGLSAHVEVDTEHSSGLARLLHKIFG
ncbi:MAG: HlyD family efflux transporter periplasmic adaptor subunit [Alphaproteobacteria bacterium]|nr:HlyD family efflux transporter periplasmic adaptor subunit [Alphaproteobacteria bacterium]